MSHVIPFPVLAARHDAYPASPRPVSLHEVVAASRRRHRALIAASGQWGWAHGVSLPADAVALWAAVAEDSGWAGDVDGQTGPWRAADLPAFVETIAAWCTTAGCLPPPDLAEALWHLYGFLAATGRLHPSSDPLTELRAAVVVFGWSDRLRSLPSLPLGPAAA